MRDARKLKKVSLRLQACSDALFQPGPQTQGPQPKGDNGNVQITGDAAPFLRTAVVIAQDETAVCSRETFETAIETAERCLHRFVRLGVRQVPVAERLDVLSPRFVEDHARDATDVGAHRAWTDLGSLGELACDAVEGPVGQIRRIRRAPPAQQFLYALAQLLVPLSGA